MVDASAGSLGSLGTFAAVSAAVVLFLFVGVLWFLLRRIARLEASRESGELQMTLQPLSEKLKDFEALVRDTYEREGRERFHLEREIQMLGAETHALAIALRGDTKAQGDWGEILVERILESSGLRAGHEFEAQAVVTSDCGEVLRPDILVRLPGDRVLVVDAKVSLTAWDRYCRADDDEERLRAMKDHVASIRRHFQALGSKRYQNAPELSTPEFVFMFTRVEPAWIEALRYEPSLIEEAAKVGVAIVSPTTLFASLKTVASLWGRDRQSKNALLIAEEAGKLYDKFVQFNSDLDEASESLARAVERLSNAKRKLSDGPGNLVDRAEKIREMGAKATKRLEQNPNP